MDQAKLYINNFIEDSEYEKELLSMYGLFNGMKRISVSIKHQPDILLFAFNKSKKYFDTYVDIIDYQLYYKDREYTINCLLNDGFDFKLFDAKKEIEFINNKVLNILSAKYLIDKKNINKKIFKNLKMKELHQLFLKIKREVIKNDHK